MELSAHAALNYKTEREPVPAAALEPLVCPSHSAQPPLVFSCRSAQPRKKKENINIIKIEITELKCFLRPCQRGSAEVLNLESQPPKCVLLHGRSSICNHQRMAPQILIRNKNVNIKLFIS